MLEYYILEETNDLLLREQHHIDSFDRTNTYNILPSANSRYGEFSSFKNKTHSEETKQKLREIRSRQIIVHSAETKAKIGEKSAGRKLSAESIEKMRNSKIGKKLTQEHIDNLLIAAKVRSNNRFSIDEKLSIVEKFNSGYSVNKLVIEFKTTYKLVVNVLKDNGVNYEANIMVNNTEARKSRCTE